MNVKKLAAMLLAAVLALSLVACQSGGSDTPTTGGSSAPGATSDSSAPATQPDEDKDTSLVMTVTAEIITLDPQVNAGGTSANTVRQNMFEALARVTSDGSIEPVLATDWEVDETNTVWTFYLREGVIFHDGETFTASDVKATFDRFKSNDESTRAYYYTNIVEVKIVDDYTVQFVTDSPQSNFLHIIAYDGSYIMSTKSLERTNEEIGKYPIGTGPYMFKESTANESVTLVRFDDYWGEKPEVTELKFITVSEVATRVNMLRAGEADLITGITDEDLEYFKGDDNFAIMYGESNRVGHLAMNSHRPGLDNLLVRQAVQYAINREAIVTGILGDRGSVANSVIAPLTYGYSDSYPYEYDPDKARELLTEAGYADGELTFVIQSPGGRYYKDEECCMAIARMLQDVGINASVEVNDWATFTSKVRVPDEENTVDMWWMGWESGTGEASKILNIVFTPENFPPTGWNAMFFDNAEYNALAASVLSIMDETEQLAVYAQMQDIIAENAVWVPVTVYNECAIYRADIDNLEITMTDVVRFTKAKIN